MNIKIKNATLLSAEEYETHKEAIKSLNIDEFYWLRTAGSSSSNAAIVYPNGFVDSPGDIVSNNNTAIVPALIIESSETDIGNRFSFGDRDFLILSKDLAICTDIIAKCCFRKERDAPDACVYEKSDVKKIVDNWFEKVMQQEKTVSITIPKNATNGDAIMALFPEASVTEIGGGSTIVVAGTYKFNETWWNHPYPPAKEQMQEKEDISPDLNQEADKEEDLGL